MSVGEKRLLCDERGFTLPEMLVTIMIMTVVLFALYSIFDMSIRIFSFGNDKVEAVENARLGLEKIERELRMAYPYDKAASTPDERLLTTMVSNEIKFGNDLNRNRKVDVPAEEITYKLNDGCPLAPSDAVCTLQRVTYSVSEDGDELIASSQPVSEFVEPGGLTFQYLDSNGNVTSTESRVVRVRVKLHIEIDRGSLGKRTQTLTTDVALRNRGR